MTLSCMNGTCVQPRDDARVSVHADDDAAAAAGNGRGQRERARAGRYFHAQLAAGRGWPRRLRLGLLLGPISYFSRSAFTSFLRHSHCALLLMTVPHVHGERIGQLLVLRRRAGERTSALQVAPVFSGLTVPTTPPPVPGVGPASVGGAARTWVGPRQRERRRDRVGLASTRAPPVPGAATPPVPEPPVPVSATPPVPRPTRPAAACAVLGPRFRRSASPEAPPEPHLIGPRRHACGKREAGQQEREAHAAWSRST